MLAALSIRDIVLIDRLDLEFGPGLCVLSGETGAGKSIVLDALALALGARGEAGLVRHGQGQGSVSAAFAAWRTERVLNLMGELGVDPGAEDLVLRRVQYADGRTRAFVNDEPVSVRLLRDIGQALVEIHGQHDERALLDPSAHLTVIDAFGGHGPLAGEVASAWRGWRAAVEAVDSHAEDMKQSARDAEFLRHSHVELESLAPVADEEELLAGERALMMAGERIVEELGRAETVLFAEGGADGQIADALAALEHGDARAPGTLAGAIEALSRAKAELEEARRELGEAATRARHDPERLEAAEERLFALRAAARKHGVGVNALPQLAVAIGEKLASLESGEERLERLERAREEARDAYLARARELSDRRREAAGRLDAAVMAELEPLRLGGARFETAFETIEQDRGASSGLDRVQFMIATNEGVPTGPLRRVASGGELSRVMLALKVALAGRGGAPTLVFDEIDSGVGGAVADAVGVRLQRLGSDVQVLVVTHSPQVAARAHDHLLIEKASRDDGAPALRTRVSRLNDDARAEEIARMLAGEQVTEEARAAALRLIGGTDR